MRTYHWDPGSEATVTIAQARALAKRARAQAGSHLSELVLPWKVPWPRGMYVGTTIENSKLGGPVIGSRYFGRLLPTAFVDATLQRVELGPVHVVNTTFRNCQFSEGSLGGDFMAFLGRTRFENCVFETMKIAATTFHQCTFQGCQFRDVTIDEVGFESCTFNDVAFSGSAERLRFLDSVGLSLCIGSLALGEFLALGSTPDRFDVPEQPTNYLVSLMSLGRIDSAKLPANLRAFFQELPAFMWSQSKEMVEDVECLLEQARPEDRKSLRDSLFPYRYASRRAPN